MGIGKNFPLFLWLIERFLQLIGFPIGAKIDGIAAIFLLVENT